MDLSARGLPRRATHPYAMKAMSSSTLLMAMNAVSPGLNSRYRPGAAADDVVRVGIDAGDDLVAILFAERVILQRLE